jgi:hypothetical protein
MFKLNKSKLLGGSLFLLLFFSYTWIHAFYISSKNVDFSKYYGYINYFTGINIEIDYGQGVFYYYLISKRLLSKVEYVNYDNLEMILNSAIQEVNFVFFLIGLLGFFFFLKLNQYKTETVLASLIVLVAFPQSIYLRSVMKPEIIAFAFLPWVLINLERFILDKKVKNLFYALPFLSLIINSKGSVAGMLIIYLAISYFKIIKKLSLKNFFLISISVIFIISLLQFENYSITGNSLLDRPYDPEYDHRAEPKILFNVDISKAIRSPFFNLDEDGKKIHSDSVMNMLFLDTFGDYFGQLFNNDEQKYFSEYRKTIFTNNPENSFLETRQINYDGKFSPILINNMDHIRRIVSFLISLFFYTSLIILSFKDKSNRKYYLASFTGVVILYINSLGFPSNNFNPVKGDTFKAYYFSFLLCVSLLFLGLKIFRKINFFKIIFLILFMGTTLFVTGHPKENNQALSEHLIFANQYTPICTINNLLIYENKILKSFFNSGNVNNLTSDCSQKTATKDGHGNRYSYDELHADNCVDNNKEVLTHRGVDNLVIANIGNCRAFALEQVKSKNNLINPRTPYFAIVIFLNCMLIIFFEGKKFIKAKY